MSHCASKLSCRGGGGCACGRAVLEEAASQVKAEEAEQTTREDA